MANDSVWRRSLRLLLGRDDWLELTHALLGIVEKAACLRAGLRRLDVEPVIVERLFLVELPIRLAEILQERRRREQLVAGFVFLGGGAASCHPYRRKRPLSPRRPTPDPLDQARALIDEAMRATRVEWKHALLSSARMKLDEARAGVEDGRAAVERRSPAAVMRREVVMTRMKAEEVSTVREKVAASAASRRFEEAGTRVLQTRRRKRYTLRLDPDAELPLDAEACAPRQLMVF